MWPFTKNISRPSREKITDDDRVYRLFELVHNNPEHQLRFYAQLKEAIILFKKQINCESMSYADVLFALTPEQCRRIADKQRQIQSYMELQGGDMAYASAFVGLLAISMEAKSGNSDTSPETIDFLNKTLVRIDDVADQGGCNSVPDIII